MVELRTSMLFSTFPATSSHSTAFFFGSFRLKEVNVKVCGLFHAESNLLTPSHLCLCACHSHLAWPLPTACATSPCPHHLMSCVTMHPTATWATSPSPHHYMHRIAVHLTVACTTSLCLSQLPTLPTSPSSS